MSIFSVFRRGLEKTGTKLVRTIGALFGATGNWDDAAFEELEYMLISADFGVKASTGIVDGIRDRYQRGILRNSDDIRAVARREVFDILASHQRPVGCAPAGTPTVILMVGVNGSGKTTTLGKIAAKWTRQGKKVILGACDTFRAAAVEQLQLWGERSGAQVVSSLHGADPAAVAFDAATAAAARKADFLLIDTAGRQQNHKGLMEELAKIRRSVAKAVPGAPHEIWLTVDATLGANAVSQVREFSRYAPVTGLVVTKLDGSGKGGMNVALHREFELPTFFVGFGESADDLQEYNPEYYTAAIFNEDSAE